MPNMNKYQKLFDLFNTAATHLKYPKITFQSDHGEKVQLYLATKGYIAIKVNGEYVGKLQPFESIHGADCSFRMYQGTTELQNNVQSFCLEPIANAVVKGQKYGHCCFCGLELTNKASVQMGYGPICADNYGLPWNYTEPVAEPLEPIPSPGIASKAPRLVSLEITIDGKQRTIQGTTAIGTEADMHSFINAAIAKLQKGI